MAKTQVVAWADFYDKKPVEAVKVAEAQKPMDLKEMAKKWVPVAVAVIGGVTVALHGDFTACASVPDAVPAMAQAGGVSDFSAQLRIATKPIRDIITSFGHEIYGVMMLWGAIEMVIGKFPQGVARMKSSTVAYIVLVWTPWIIKTISSTASAAGGY